MSRAASSHTTKATNNPAHTATPKRETTWLLAVDSGGAYFPAKPTAAPPASTSRLAGRVRLRTSLKTSANTRTPAQRSPSESGRTTGCAAGCEAADGDTGSPVTDPDCTSTPRPDGRRLVAAVAAVDPVR